MSRAATLALAFVLVGCGGASNPAATDTAASGATFAITSPVDGAVVARPNLFVQGRAPAGATVTQDINLAPDARAAADSSGNWSIVVALKDGSNTLTFRLGDDKSTDQTITVTYGSIAAAAPEGAATAEPTATPEVTEAPTPTATPEPTPNPPRANAQTDPQAHPDRLRRN